MVLLGFFALAVLAVVLAAWIMVATAWLIVRLALGILAAGFRALASIRIER